MSTATIATRYQGSHPQARARAARTVSAYQGGLEHRGNTALTNARGLDSCQHLGPSIVDHRTLQRSGRLPEVFLSGCGPPDNFIKYLPSLFWGRLPLRSKCRCCTAVIRLPTGSRGQH
jgi:hypothetical protein